MNQVTSTGGGTIRILIVGGGCAGLASAQRLQRELQQDLRSGRAEITLVEAAPYLTCRPLLAEVAAGAVDPRHVVVPLRGALPDCRVLAARTSRIDHARRLAWLAPQGGIEVELPYDELILAVGACSRRPPIPGLAEHGLGFETVGEAVALRARVLEQLDLASTTRDVELRHAALTFVFVGAGYGGVSALAELADLVRRVLRDYPNIQSEDLRWVLVEPGDGILAEADPELAESALEQLRDRNVDIRLGTTLESAEEGLLVLSDGTKFAARTLVWTAGVRPAPLLAATDLPLTADGRVHCLDTLQVVGPDGGPLPGAWAAGDCAAVPAAPGGHCRRGAQHALAQAELLAGNLLATRTGAVPEAYHPEPGDASASLGPRNAVAHAGGRRLTGRRARLVHRARTLRQVPSAERRVRILADWLLGGLFASGPRVP
ncbi:FAD-dependent oxidoreductase [Kitasatospora sp. RB6PN24]|uniref:NAD(P)/FAD-dependent oxidoreductase n=1 Tax=Kitasatospora humi TaxID=2893891 RepID=UPI001E2CF66B|nr:FAD-dependent oxidoreductase [Kitasatospora humi]MCC9309046.1 FAD-dependent oxidoreductase [Kitasatospora humi]